MEIVAKETIFVDFQYLRIFVDVKRVVNPITGDQEDIIRHRRDIYFSKIHSIRSLNCFPVNGYVIATTLQKEMAAKMTSF